MEPLTLSPKGGQSTVGGPNPAIVSKFNRNGLQGLAVENALPAKTEIFYDATGGQK